MKFQIYLDSNSEYRWRLRAQNGKVVADSGEGYKKKASCKKAITKVSIFSIYAKIEDKTK
jgi:uncharacterized protein YegP (UPF0339 family)